MYLVDEVKINACAGHGGNGVVRWRREKFIDKGGPNGGDGGKGGDVYVRAVRDTLILKRYTEKKIMRAGHGSAGEGNQKHGSAGADLYIDLPIGCIVKNETTGFEFELENEGDEVMILRGGAGGLGNEHFKSSTNTTPTEATGGKAGDESVFTVTLQLFGDVGLIGMPNAGKSSLINLLTNANAKVGDYAFTTLDPNLGDFHGYIIADIPGLIEGASEGRGLGHKFLRHIKRTKILVHLVSFEDGFTDITDKASFNVERMQNIYTKIRNELGKFDKDLLEKDEVVLLTKTDAVDAKVVKSAIKEFKKLNKKAFAITMFDDEAVKEFADELIKIVKKDSKK